jgi:lambda family phage portal protein
VSSASVARQRLTAILPVDKANRGIAEAVVRHQVEARAHEATRVTRSRKLARDYGGPNQIASQDARQLRNQARHLERNHDISRNVLNVLEQNTVGSGIDVIPAPRLPNGNIDTDLAARLAELWDDFWDRPEVTWRHDFGKTQQLMARSAYRDGDVFYQELTGPVAYLEHGSLVPYSIEMIEADLVPLEFNAPERRIFQGCEVNAWGRPIAWHVYKSHPGELATLTTETKRVDASYLRQIAHLDRIGQIRGLSVFASVMTRLDDIKDYEESERIAAKVAASLTAFIKKGNPELYGADALASTSVVPGAGGERAYRDMRMVPGMIADDLLPGESVEVIDSKRPNPNAETFRTGQLRAASGGVRVSFSSMARNYDGTYSAQRQELVEQWGAYELLAELFIAQYVRPVWRGFVQASVMSGLVKLPRAWTVRHLAAASFQRPVMPWIDPLKEAYARGEAEDRGWSSPQQNALALGNNPDDVLRQRAEWDRQRPRDPAAPPTDDVTARAQTRSAAVAALLRNEE